MSNKLCSFIKFLAVFSTLFVVSGCAIYKTGFECPASKGEGCRSVSEVNDMVNKGEIGRGISVWENEQHVGQGKKTQKHIHTDFKKTGKTISKYHNSVLKKKGKCLQDGKRIKEEASKQKTQKQISQEGKINSKPQEKKNSQQTKGGCQCSKE